MWPSRCAQLYRFKMAPGYPGIHGLAWLVSKKFDFQTWKVKESSPGWLGRPGSLIFQGCLCFLRRPDQYWWADIRARHRYPDNKQIRKENVLCEKRALEIVYHLPPIDQPNKWTIITEREWISAYIFRVPYGPRCARLTESTYLPSRRRGKYNEVKRAHRGPYHEENVRRYSQARGYYCTYYWSFTLLWSFTARLES